MDEVLEEMMIEVGETGLRCWNQDTWF